MSDTTVHKIDILVDTFEDACRSGLIPDVVPYLEKAEPSDRPVLLSELVRLELEYKLRAGQVVAVEEYLSRYPELASNRTNVLDLILLEARVRLACSLPVQTAEYLARFPGYGDELAPALSAFGKTTVKVPGYEVLEELGRGGMGVVYRARDVRLGRPVALKMILAGVHAEEEDRSRFRREAEAIARLQHPGVVQIHEVGEHDGRPFFALEFCSGGSLDRKLAGGALQPREAAVMVEKIAQAIQAAHDAQVVHRDLKPANVLLTADGVPKVTDFGLAKRLDTAGHTKSGEIMGTPSYMAPEQASGRTKEVGPLSDVYSLGAILYECLTGKPPFHAATALDTVMQVISADPIAPKLLNAKVPVDLETICLKCLRKERERRYSSAGDLAADLGRFLRGEAVTARPMGRLERGWRWCRRNPAVAALLSVFLIALTGGILTVSVLGLQAIENAAALERKIKADADAHQEKERQRKQEEDELARANKETAERIQEAQQANDEAVKRTAEFHRIEAKLEKSQANLYTAQMHRVAKLVESDPMDARDLLHDYTKCPINRRDPTWHYYDLACERVSGPQFWHRKEANSAAWNSQGTLLAVATGEGTIKVWNVALHEARSLRGHDGSVKVVAFHPKNDWLAFAGTDGKVILWDIAKGEQLGVFGEHSKQINALAFNSAGDRLLSGSADGSAILWDVTKKKRLFTMVYASTFEIQREQELKPVLSVAYSPDGKMIAIGGFSPVSSEIALWEAQNGKHLANLKGHSTGVAGVAFSADSKTLVSCGDDEFVKLWDVAERSLIATLGDRSNGVRAVKFSPDGTTLASGGTDKCVRIWDVEQRRLQTIFRGHSAAVVDVVFRPDGKAIAGATSDGSVKLWNLDKKGDFTDFTQNRPVWALDISPDGSLMAAGDAAGVVEIWSTNSKKPVHTLKKHKGMVTAVCFSPNGKLLATGGDDKKIQFWNPETGAHLATLAKHAEEIGGIAFSPDGKLLASGSKDKTIKLWDVESKTVVANLKGHSYWVLGVAFSPDGKWLASAGADNDVRLWDVAERKPIDVLKGHTEAVEGVSFSPDGTTLASCGHDNTVRLWDIATRKELLPAIVHPNMVSCVTFSPDGNAVVSGDDDRTLRFFSPTTGQEQLALATHGDSIRCIRFSKNGDFMASAGRDRGDGGEIQLRKMRLGPVIASFPGNSSQNLASTFFPRGDAILVFHENGQLSSIDTTTGKPSIWSSALGGTPVCASFSGDGQTLAWGDKEGAISMRNTITGKTHVIAQAHADPVRTVALSSDGLLLASVSEKSAIKIWDLRQKKELASCVDSQGQALRLGFRPDGLLLGSGGPDGRITLWNSRTGGETLDGKVALLGHGTAAKGDERRHESAIRSLAFSPDGKRLAAGGVDGRIIVWSDAAPLVLLGHTGEVSALAFSPDGLVLVSGGEDRTLRQWNAATGARFQVHSGQKAQITGLTFHPTSPQFLSAGRHGALVLWQDNIPRIISETP